MKIRVQQEDGRIEVLTLVPPITVGLGEKLSTLSCASGIDHYFTEKGFYDGWGASVDGVSEEEASAAIDRIEASREIESR